ncbi:MAG TPA: biotin/lipoyl-binding protein, partial [Candidatus Deferrimicrobium sp.]
MDVLQVLRRDVPIFQEWIGTADGMVNATIRAQVTGYLIRQNYKEGDFIRNGQVLFEIDPRTFQAALAQAEAQESQAAGQLAQAEAQHTNTRANLERVRPLADQNAVSKKDL